MATHKHRKKRQTARGRTPRIARGRASSASSAATETIWLYGVHAVHAALSNRQRHVRRLLSTESAAADLPASAIAPEIVERQAIDEVLPDGAVHQGLALLTSPSWAQRGFDPRGFLERMDKNKNGD